MIGVIDKISKNYFFAGMVIIIFSIGISCCTPKEECIDKDGDGYGKGCDRGPDCSENDPYTPSRNSCPEMAFIPGGCYHNTDQIDLFSAPPNQRDLTVCISDFYLDVHEVTNFQYKNCIAAGFCEEKEVIVKNISNNEHYFDYSLYDNYPYFITEWRHATDYCSWVGKRLPTSFEWIYAAKAGVDDVLFPWGDDFACENENFNNCQTQPVEVGSYPPNDFGLYDMVGNVEEWCSDFGGYENYPEIVTDPIGSYSSACFIYLFGASGYSTTIKQDFECRIKRGVSYLTELSKTILNNAFTGATYGKTSSISGFRCARSIPNNSSQPIISDAERAAMNQPSWPIPDTGWEHCDKLFDPVPCASSSAPPQDGNYYSTPISHTVNSNGTVTDNITGLVWQTRNPAKRQVWDDAIKHCENLELAGYSDWRAPNSFELHSIVNYEQDYNLEKEIEYNYNETFADDRGAFWTATTFAGDSRKAWLIDFINDAVVVNGDKQLLNYIRCVR